MRHSAKQMLSLMNVGFFIKDYNLRNCKDIWYKLEAFKGNKLTFVIVSEQEDEWDALHRHQTLSGHYDSLWLSSLLSLTPAALLHDWENGEMSSYIIRI